MHKINDSKALRPPLVLSAEDHARLVALAGVMARRNPLIARLLLEEADRAEVMPAGHVPPPPSPGIRLTRVSLTTRVRGATPGGIGAYP